MLPGSGAATWRTAVGSLAHTPVFAEGTTGGPVPIGERINALPLPALWEELAAHGRVDRLLALARDEDVGDRGDITSALVAEARDVGGGGSVRADVV